MLLLVVIYLNFLECSDWADWVYEVFSKYEYRYYHTRRGVGNRKLGTNRNLPDNNIRERIVLLL
jgi:hypothetical protein